MKTRRSAVTVSAENGLATFRLSREHGNAIDLDLVEGLIDACRRSSADPSVRGVLLASSGRLFCPGFDLQVLIGLGREEMDRFMGKFHECLLAQIHAGADFATVAKTSSEDPVTAARGGDGGYFSRGEMDPAFEAAALALGPGQISGVVETRYGFEIIKVTDRRDAGYTPLEEAEPVIREVLLKSARQDRQSALVAELRKKAKVELVEPLH